MAEAQASLLGAHPPKRQTGKQTCDERVPTIACTEGLSVAARGPQHWPWLVSRWLRKGEILVQAYPLNGSPGDTLMAPLPSASAVLPL